MTTSPGTRTPSMSKGHYRLDCGIPALELAIAESLAQLGWEVTANAPVLLVVDGPWGYALHAIRQGDASQLVLLTDNPCPEYAEDLWSLRPRALLAGGHSYEAVVAALGRADAGEFFRHTPQHDSQLTVIERTLLRCSAMGWENRRIASEIHLSEGTVKNGLSRVFQKLGFENRTQLALYYWGLWHLLANGLHEDFQPRLNIALTNNLSHRI